jgi:hypothetical protein
VDNQKDLGSRKHDWTALPPPTSIQLTTRLKCGSQPDCFHPLIHLSTIRPSRNDRLAYITSYILEIHQKPRTKPSPSLRLLAMTAPRPSTYDVFRPSALPSASLGQRGAAPVAGLATDDSAVAVRDAEGELKRASEAWNKRIDKEVKAMAGGLKDLVSLADVSNQQSSGCQGC